MFFWELAALIDIMLLGHWIEMKSVMGASRALEELAKLMPSEAHKFMPDGSVKDVPLGELAVNDKVLVKPGEKIPADGVIVKGESSVNEAMLTGESTPVTKEIGGKVNGGSINGEGSLTVEVKSTGKDSFLSQVRIWSNRHRKVNRRPRIRQHRGALAHHCRTQRTITLLFGWLLWARTLHLPSNACYGYGNYLPSRPGVCYTSGGSSIHFLRSKKRTAHKESRFFSRQAKASGDYI